jgi:hypothetical protein
MTLRAILDMKDEDRLRAAERLLDDPLAMGLLSLIERDAINDMIAAPDDQSRREARDKITTIRSLRDMLIAEISKVNSAKATELRKRTVV